MDRADEELQCWCLHSEAHINQAACRPHDHKAYAVTESGMLAIPIASIAGMRNIFRLQIL